MEVRKMLKTHNCGELNISDDGKNVVLAGWLQVRRDLGGLIFLELRDRSGLVQVTVDPSVGGAFSVAEKVRNEYVLQIEGKVRIRPEGTVNPNLVSGEIEVLAQTITILNPSKTVPLPIDDDGNKTDETIRLKYRYLDLRRPRLQKNIMLRHRIIKFMRDYLDKAGFVEIETPMLIKSTPEGARDYVVPSRVQRGKFYALPQSPQQLKQLLMVAGFEKYFQIARCMRDEDLRGDRQPEFTQLDIEMSFVEREDVLSVVEGMIAALIPAVTPHKRIISPFPTMTYEEAMNRFGTDKPDFRFGMEILDLTDEVRNSELILFSETIAAGGVVKCMVVPGCSHYSRKDLDILTELVRSAGARNLATLAWTPEGIKGTAAKKLSQDELRKRSVDSGVRLSRLACFPGGEAPCD